LEQRVRARAEAIHEPEVSGLFCKEPRSPEGCKFFQAFCQTFPNITLVFSKLFQRFLWRFHVISMGYGAEKAFLRESKFFALLWAVPPLLSFRDFGIGSRAT
jgi:hypothetical protein